MFLAAVDSLHYYYGESIHFKLFLCIFLSIKSLSNCMVHVVRHTVDLNVSSNMFNIFQLMMMHGGGWECGYDFRIVGD
jgi:hypothetical protein